ncbi:uncharacterized protein DNG_08660 [Cephalotrichum gorgonifer]|uniref:MOSC domain-containing protein n=1 Tax=Cephalotrichum gorgonifer TaxID=2041049 RepID=A0AAE8SYK4_9PEZI|nr:uncharacterized protein DNG_08660 [Cephalotrichum gorgonifer]
MIIESLYVYPIKGLRGAPLASAQLTPQGLRHDRRFMLWSLAPDGSLKAKIQVVSHPEVALFAQVIVGEGGQSVGDDARGDGKSAAEPPSVVVRYLTPEVPLVPHHPSHDAPLRAPLEPDTAALESVEMTMYGSGATVYRMGEPYDEWFSSCLGYPAALLYIGDGRRPQLGFRPATRLPKQSPLRRLISYVSGLIMYVLFLIGLATRPEDDWIVFTDLAPFLVTSTASLSDISSRIPDGPVGMHRFRPNIVVGPGPGSNDDGPSPWAEDFWSQLTISPPPSLRGDTAAAGSTLQMTGNCCRCVSVNVDYATGRPSTGTRGDVLKKMMRDRRVDRGQKWSAVFGRYASLLSSGGAISLGDEVSVRTTSERDVWDWPSWNSKPKEE